VIFQGRALWHCSIALWSRTTGKPTLTSSWGRDYRRIAASVAIAVLRGVGDTDQEIVEFGDTAVHRRRCMTTGEQATLPRQPLEQN